MMLEVEGLGSHYGRIPALKGIDLHVGDGELVALVGANGAGKTTLLRALSGVQPVSAGRGRRQGFAPLSVEDNLRLGAYLRSKAEAAQGIERVYAMFPVLKQKRREPAGTRSGGR